LSDETIQAALKGARKAGVKVGIGTDVPFENEKRYPSDYFVEIELFQKAGYTNEEILASATRIGGEILQLDDKLGTLEKGKLADVLVVAENPLDDIQNLQKMRLVVADGRVVRNRIQTPRRETDSQ
jgi:imidazolonepropionase-like amidohydrolase